MDGKKIDQDPMQMPSWSLGMAMAWIAHRDIEDASELWETSLEAALFEEDDETGLNRSFSDAERALKTRFSMAAFLLPDCALMDRGPPCRCLSGKI